MSKNLLLGPLLALEAENTYSVCFLAQGNQCTVKINNKDLAAIKTAETRSGDFWRIELDIKAEASGRKIPYEIMIDGEKAKDANSREHWEFYIPGTNERPKLIYASCNGFSTFDLLKNAENPYNLWEELIKAHTKNPYALLMMGGDQVYADELWTAVDGLKEWVGLKYNAQITALPSPSLISELDKFFEKLYLHQWNQEVVSLALASIPTVMMWDDHDIFDGWGSYPGKIQNCAVYKEIFAAAKKHFEIFQMRKRPAERLLNPGNSDCYFIHYRQYTILALDHRSQRSLEQVMGDQQWDAFIKFLKEVELRKTLLVLSAVPIVYRDFGAIETGFGLSPWNEELTDDLKDHWRAKEHQGERLRFIQQLLSELKKRTERHLNIPEQNADDWHFSGAARTVILSGDVHVGALGVIMDRREKTPIKVHQVISSGIVHPSPTALQWAGILAVTNDRNEYLNEDKTVEAAMLKPIGSNQYIRARNYTTIQEGTDKKLWINWCNESNDKAEYPLE